MGVGWGVAEIVLAMLEGGTSFELWVLRVSSVLFEVWSYGYNGSFNTGAWILSYADHAGVRKVLPCLEGGRNKFWNPPGN